MSSLVELNHVRYLSIYKAMSLTSLAFQNCLEGYLRPDCLFNLVIAVRDASQNMATALSVLSSHADLGPLSSTCKNTSRTLTLVWKSIIKVNGEFCWSLSLLKTRQENTPSDSDFALMSITLEMAKMVKACRTVVEDTNVVIATWQKNVASLAAKSKPPVQTSSMLGRMMWLWSHNSPLPDVQDRVPDIETLRTIHDFLTALSDLSAAIQGIEAYWSKRLYSGAQFGAPLVATWEQVEMFAPDWIQLYYFCDPIQHFIFRDAYDISHLEDPLSG